MNKWLSLNVPCRVDPSVNLCFILMYCCGVAPSIFCSHTLIIVNGRNAENSKGYDNLEGFLHGLTVFVGWYEPVSSQFETVLTGSN